MGCFTNSQVQATTALSTNSNEVVKKNSSSIVLKQINIEMQDEVVLKPVEQESVQDIKKTTLQENLSANDPCKAEEGNDNNELAFKTEESERSVDTLVQVLTESAKGDALLYRDTVFVPEMGVHPVDGRQNISEL